LINRTLSTQCAQIFPYPSKSFIASLLPRREVKALYGSEMENPESFPNQNFVSTVFARSLYTRAVI